MNSPSVRRQTSSMNCMPLWYRSFANHSQSHENATRTLTKKKQKEKLLKTKQQFEMNNDFASTSCVTWATSSLSFNTLLNTHFCFSGWDLACHRCMPICPLLNGHCPVYVSRIWSRTQCLFSLAVAKCAWLARETGKKMRKTIETSESARWTESQRDRDGER